MEHFRYRLNVSVTQNERTESVGERKGKTQLSCKANTPHFKLKNKMEKPTKHDVYKAIITLRKCKILSDKTIMELNALVEEHFNK